LVALAITMLTRAAMITSGPVAADRPALVDLAGLALAVWQLHVLVELDGAARRNTLSVTTLVILVTGLRALAWVGFVLDSGFRLAGAARMGVVLAAAAHIGGPLVLLGLVALGRWAFGPFQGKPRSTRFPYLVAGTTMAAVGPLFLIDERLLRPSVVALGAVGALTLMLRQALSQARLRQALDEISRSREYLASLLKDSSDVVMIADRSGRLSYVSPSAERVLGAGDVSAGGAVWTAIALPERAFSEAVARLDSGEGGPQLLEGRREHIVLEAAVSIRGDDVLVSVRDVTERDRLRQRLHYLAYHDPLTGLANRSRVLSRISAMISRSELCAVLFVDLDRFKQVNDNSGHAVGDQVLQQVAQRLAGMVRSGDLIGRLGGDEFVAVLAVGREEAQLVATRIREALSAPFEVSGREYQLGVSIGIAEGVPGLLAEDLLRRADLAMYAAKRQPGSWVVYQAGLGRAALAQANTDVAVSRALRDKDMDVFLQPLVNLTTGGVVAVESLLRWRNESGTVCGPGEMLDFARRSGRIPEVTSWVLQRSVELIAASRTDVSIAINMPPEMLLVPTIPRHLAELLRLHGVQFSRIEVEVTEDQLLEQAESSSTTLQRLRDLGIPVMIDDFGTGFSSLGYLLDLPIDGLKIDQRFTKALPYSESARSIVSGLVGIAGRLDLRVVAEGIENAEQHEWACRLGVHVGQGFWYARPESASSLADLADLASWSSSKVHV
jgi:diguanylate cyclase (GGDEF)-like protein/PAS domain S-box-containing protein